MYYFNKVMIFLNYLRWDFWTVPGAEELSRINSSPARAAGEVCSGEDFIRLNSSEFKNLTSVQ